MPEGARAAEWGLLGLVLTMICSGPVLFCCGSCCTFRTMSSLHRDAAKTNAAEGEGGEKASAKDAPVGPEC